MPALTLEEWIALLEKGKFVRATDDTTTTQLLATVDEDRIALPLAMIVSDTSGAQNSVNFSRTGENVDTIHGQFNVGANETIIVTMDELAFVLPRIEGGSGIEITASVDGADVTLVYLENVEV